MKVSKGNYGQYSSDNYGAHTLYFDDAKGNRFYYSYDTLVAFRTAESGLVIRQNDWGPTTGKHLNWINKNHSLRVSGEVFEQKYKDLFKEAPSKGIDLDDLDL